MRVGAIVTAIVAIGAVSVGTYAFLANASPYVTVKEAMSEPGRTCNVAGELLHETVRSDLAAGILTFQIKDDDGGTLPIVYKGSKPGNFDSAPRVSVLGAYKDGSFVAERILVKCPSKYEGGDKAKGYSGKTS